MPSIPVDVFRLILEHADKEDLANLCLLNKICCSCSQDVLYREILLYREIDRSTLISVCQTLAQSTHLAKRVRSFEIHYEHPSLAEALRNMSSIRKLRLCFQYLKSPTLLEGCTFKLDSLFFHFPFDESLRTFLNSQPSLTCLSFISPSGLFPFEEVCLPNITRATWCLRFGTLLAPLASIFPSLTHLILSVHISRSKNNMVCKSFY